MNRFYTLRQKALLWYLLSLVISASNDALTKWLEIGGMQTEQVTFYRITIGLVILSLYILFRKPVAFRTSKLTIHIIRGGMFFIASGLWGFGLQYASLASATTISFTIPLFILVLASVFLREKVDLTLWIATCIGFVGIVLLLLDPVSVLLNLNTWQTNRHVIAFIISALLFSSLDIINKAYLKQDSILSMLFYSNLMATLFALPWFSFHVTIPSLHQQAQLFCLALGGIGILFCILKAYSLVAISSLAPLRYLELLIASLIDYYCFYELPTLGHMIAATIIIPASLFVVWHPSQS